MAKPKRYAFSSHTWPSQQYDWELEDIVKHERFGAHFITFIALAAATLEARLNDFIVDVSNKHCPRQSQHIADAVLSMSLASKLDFIVPFMTKFKFVVNVDSAEYKDLRHLVSLRNRILHRKEHYETVQVEAESQSEIDEMYVFHRSLAERRLSKGLPAPKMLDRALSELHKKRQPSRAKTALTKARALDIFRAIQCLDEKLYDAFDEGNLKPNGFVKRP